jgi:hypothetical protein
VCWIAEKWEEKQASRSKIYSPGALLAFALDDLPGWMNQKHGAQVIDSIRRWEEAEAYRRGQFDPAVDVKALAAKKGMR